MSNCAINLFVITIIIIKAVAAANLFETENNDKYRIVGGQNASIADHPYQVALYDIIDDITDVFRCGGFIVSENYILTAGHCVQEKVANKLLVRAGSSWRKDGTIILIAEAVWHPDFIGFPPYDKDIGVMKTVNPIKFTDVIQPVKLPRKQTPLKDDSIVTASGWGKINETCPQYLRSVDFPVVNFYDCWTTYGKMLTRNMWCGGDWYLGGLGISKGDSGGAIVQNGVAVGIVSWTEPGAPKHYPGVFTDIAAPAVREYIFEQTGL